MRKRLFLTLTLIALACTLTTAPITTTSSNWQGIACSLACSDHKDAMGNQLCIQGCLKADPLSILELLIE